MSIVRAVDSDGDWLFGKGRNDYKSGVDATAQNIKTRLQSFLGDCFFDTGAGVDWFNLLGSKQLLALKIAVAAIILNTTDVTGILELSFNLDETRRLTIQYKTATIYGTVQNSFQFDFVI